MTHKNQYTYSHSQLSARKEGGDSPRPDEATTTATTTTTGPPAADTTTPAVPEGAVSEPPRQHSGGSGGGGRAAVPRIASGDVSSRRGPNSPVVYIPDAYEDGQQRAAGVTVNSAATREPESMPAVRIAAPGQYSRWRG